MTQIVHSIKNKFKQRTEAKEDRGFVTRVFLNAMKKVYQLFFSSHVKSSGTCNKVSKHTVLCCHCCVLCTKICCKTIIASELINRIASCLGGLYSNTIVDSYPKKYGDIFRENKITTCCSKRKDFRIISFPPLLHFFCVC